MRPVHLVPVLSVTAGIATFSLMDAAIKSAGIATGVFTALWLRSAIGFAITLPLWLWTKGRIPALAVLRVHALRAAVVACMALLFFWGLVRVPMAEGIAISFISPLIALYLAAVMLGERIRPEAIIASLFGLAGVVVIAAAKFGGGPVDTASASGFAAILASALFYAWNLVLQRQQALLAGPVEVALFQNLFVALVFTIGAPFLARMPNSGALADIAMGAVLATAALMLLAWGYARAEAQVLLPIEYTGFVWAALFGWTWFREPLGAATVAGAVLIVFGSWYATRNRPQPPETVPSAP